MVASPVSRFSFTKLVVADLEAMSAFYQEVYGLTEVVRYSAEVAGRPIDEIILGGDGGSSGLILFKFLDRAIPANDEVLLGFTTDDVGALFERGVAAGGMVWADVTDPELAGVALVGFLADPEGHLAEVVQTAPTHQR
jgi:catechol 2,3-dioxygenase-like lactoylglutathione lyase family enzyme